MKRRLLFAVAVAAALSSAASAQVPEAYQTPLRIEGVAMDQITPGRSAGSVTIVIERWTTDQEREKLLAVLVEKGREKLVEVVRDVKPRAGFIKGPKANSWDIMFARLHLLPDGAGYRVVLVTDRPIGLWERANTTVYEDYEFVVAELRFDKDGKGEGKVATATKIDFDKAAGKLEVQSYATLPVLLNSLVLKKK